MIEFYETIAFRMDEESVPKEHGTMSSYIRNKTYLVPTRNWNYKINLKIIVFISESF